MANPALEDDPIDVGHSALIVPIPSAEPAVRDLRRTHDPNARFGVPAHITVLSPWIPPAALGGDDLTAIHELASGHTAFNVRLKHLAWFRGDGQPHVLYLQIADPAPFLVLTQAVAARWPLFLPYGGAHGPEPTPHLTVALTDDETALAQAAADLAQHLPIQTTAVQLDLLLREPGGQHFVCAAQIPFG